MESLYIQAYDLDDPEAAWQIFCLSLDPYPDEVMKKWNTSNRVKHCILGIQKLADYYLYENTENVEEFAKASINYKGSLIGVCFWNTRRTEIRTAR